MSEETNGRESNQKEIRNEIIKKRKAKKKKKRRRTVLGCRWTEKKSKTAAGEMAVTPVKTNAVRQRG